MALVGLGLNCLKSSSPSRLPLATRFLHTSRFTRLGPNSSRSHDLVLLRLGPTTSRSFSLWPKSTAATTTTSPASTPVDPSKDEPVSTSSSQLSDSLPEGLDLSQTTTALPPAESTANTLSSSSDALSTSISTLSTSSDTLSSTADALSSLSTPIQALQYGDLSSLGLIHYTPVGLIRTSLELINVSLSLPWLQTLILGALLWRLLLLPLSISQLSFSSRMAYIQPHSQALMSSISTAKSRGDLVEMQKIQKDLLGLYKTVGIKSPLQGIIGPLVQLPVAIGMFLGVKGMCELPLEQMRIPEFSVGTGGVLENWIPDLTVADPTGILAPAFAVTMFWQMTVTARDMDIAASPAMAHVMNLMRFPGAPVFALFMSTLPSGLVISIITASLATGIQSILLRQPAIRRYFGILPPPPASLRSSVPANAQAVSASLPQAQAQIREAVQQAQAQAQAGQGSSSSSQAVQGAGPAAVGSTRRGLPSFMDTFRWLKQWWRNQVDEARRKAEEVEEQKRRGGGSAGGPPRRRL
ncbi:hypothetical protein GYMLUDRAFT_69965 [Collybiopsis luxurians FD-317 M1]|nr:hypothetical protein GYMLUDRAFT_69965 [Collybiopsis luxurians FD-317 M1]